MKNYLFYPDCFTEESINHCRFALLKYLGLYNLQPPANISVIVHTNKAAAFEIFQPFFAEMMLKDNQPKAGWSDLASLQQLTSGYQGNHLVCRPLGHPREKLDDLYLRISQGNMLYSLPQTTDVLPPTPAQLSEKAIVIGINTQTIKQSAQGYEGELQNISTHFTIYSNRKEITNLLRLFFSKNEEESTANLVKKAKGLDLEALEKERITTKNLPFFKRMVQKFRKKNSLLQHYRNKL